MQHLYAVIPACVAPESTAPTLAAISVPCLQHNQKSAPKSRSPLRGGLNAPVHMAINRNNQTNQRERVQGSQTGGCDSCEIHRSWRPCDHILYYSHHSARLHVRLPGSCSSIPGAIYLRRQAYHALLLACATCEIAGVRANRRQVSWRRGKKP